LSSGESSNHRPSLGLITVCTDEETTEVVRQAAAQKHGTLIGELHNYLPGEGERPFLEGLRDAAISVCVIDFDQDRELAVLTATAMQQMLGQATLIAVSSKAEPSLILEAMRAGCSEYLTKPVAIEQLSVSLDRLRNRFLPNKPSPTKPTGKVLVFLGARGGAGATTLAVHLGNFLARQHAKKVLIVDVHRRLGHIALYLGEDRVAYHFYELVRNINRLDAALLEGFVLHHASGVDVLPSPDVFDDSSNVSLDDIQRAIRFLAECYDFVIIDSPHGVHNLSLSAIDCCDELFLIASPDVPGLRDLSRCVDRLLQSHVSPDKLKVVINRYSSQGAVTLEQIEKAIRQPIAITIPNNSTELIRAMNTGNPISPDRKSEFAIQMRKWAASLVPSAATPEPKRKFAFWS